jgi:far upstream element-binding protein
MAGQPDVQAILAALQGTSHFYHAARTSCVQTDTMATTASQNNAGTPLQQQQPHQPPPGVAPQYSGYTPQPMQATSGYNLPQPSASGSVDLSAIRPVSTGNVQFQDALAKVRNYAADKGISYDPNRSNSGKSHVESQCL